MILASKIVLTKSWTFPDERLKHFLTDFQGQGFVKKEKYLIRFSVSSFP